MALLRFLFDDTVPCMASWAVIKSPVYKCICTRMNKYKRGLAKLTSHCISNMVDVNQQLITTKAMKTPIPQPPKEGVVRSVVEGFCIDW